MRITLSPRLKIAVQSGIRRVQDNVAISALAEMALNLILYGWREFPL
jgi:hypothetical protein